MESSPKDQAVDPRIHVYLSDVERTMPKVPKDRRDSLLLELRSHIDRLAEEYVEAGKTPSSAVSDALSMMGKPKMLGRDYVSKWYRSTEPGSVLTAIGVIEISRFIISPVQNYIAVRQTALNNLHINMGFGVALWLLSLLAGCIVAGWLSPRGAVKATAISVALTAVNVLSTAIAMPRNPNILDSNYVNLGIATLGVGLAALTVRLRKRKFAGI